ncbi:Protein phosphatase 2C 2 [Sorochytrium milnesiophthora]
MGQTLSEPITEKHTSEGGDARFIYGASAMQGWRISMEDAHTTELNALGKGFAFFAVYDGHGGQTVARISGADMHRKIAEQESFANKDYKKAIKQGFLALDRDLKTNPEFETDPSGCTAVAALVVDSTLYVGNAGDSRAVLSCNGEAVPLSFDHKPNNPEEQERIVAAGGFVEFGRVNGNLALSRAIGDFEFKQSTNLPAEEQAVTAYPDVTERQLTENDEFMVIACDGIWDCMSNDEVVRHIRQQIYQGSTLAQTCEWLMDKCLAPDSEIGGVGCDNMTVVIVAFLQGRTSEEWYQMVKMRYHEQSASKPDDAAAAAPATDGQSETNTATAEQNGAAAEDVDQQSDGSR